MGDLPGLRGKSVRADAGVAGELTGPKTRFNPGEGRGANPAPRACGRRCLPAADGHDDLADLLGQAAGVLLSGHLGRDRVSLILVRALRHGAHTEPRQSVVRPRGSGQRTSRAVPPRPRRRRKDLDDRDIGSSQGGVQREALDDPREIGIGMHALLVRRPADGDTQPTGMQAARGVVLRMSTSEAAGDDGVLMSSMSPPSIRNKSRFE